MTSTYSWIVLLLSLSSIASAQTCRWFQQDQDEWTKRFLYNFNQMVPAEKRGQLCHENTAHLPVIDRIDSISDITQVESAAIAVHEVSKQTIEFYTRNQDRLANHQPAKDAWESLQQLIYQQEQQLSDCIPKEAKNQRIRQRFNTLQRILEEQADAECAWRTVHSEIGRNLRLAAQLSARMRKQNSRY